MSWFNVKYEQTDTKDRTASFEHNRTRENIKSGEKHSTIFGKIARYLEDLKLVAFTGSYNDLTGRPQTMAPSAHTHKKNEITDFPASMPASDVSAWAKAASKPLYSWSEITGKPDVVKKNGDTITGQLAFSKLNKAPIAVGRYSWNIPLIHFETGNSNYFVNIYTSDDGIRVSYDDANNNPVSYIHLMLSGETPGIESNDRNKKILFKNMYYTFGGLTFDAHIGNTARLGCIGNTDGLNTIDIATYKTDAGNYTVFLRPNDATSGYLGSPSARWKEIYGVNGSISTSDRNLKDNISYIGQDSPYFTKMADGTLVKFMTGLLPCIFTRNDGESGRPHHGLVSQDIEELLKKLGIKDHAGFIKTPKTRDVAVEKNIKKEDGTTETITETVQEVIPGEYTYSLRYQEFIADIIRFCQILYDKNMEQDKRIEGLEERLMVLEKMEGSV